MHSQTYHERRAQLTTYFDHTAHKAWEKLTSTDPVSKIRATVRAGREAMRNTLFSWLPPDLSGCRLLDAGCGTGALAFEAARRGADVVAIDVAPKLIEIAERRRPLDPLAGRVAFRVGDMLDPVLGDFDFVVAMDSLIHYRDEDIAAAVTSLSRRSSRSVLFTFAPRTKLLTLMHTVGRLIPHREHRAPSIVPVSETRLRSGLESALPAGDWQTGRTHRVTTGFYISQGFEIERK